MKPAQLYLSLAVIAVISCDAPQPSSEKSDAPSPVENKIMIPASSCYAFNNGKDSVRLKVEVFPNVITGMLSYRLYEKDANTGELDGHLYGDTLLADYAFMSEGVRSVRQVAFLIRDSVAIEGHGQMKEENGKMLFTNVESLNFGKGMILKKVPCGY